MDLVVDIQCPNGVYVALSFILVVEISHKVKRRILVN